MSSVAVVSTRLGSAPLDVQAASDWLHYGALERGTSERGDVERAGVERGDFHKAGTAGAGFEQAGSARANAGGASGGGSSVEGHVERATDRCGEAGAVVLFSGLVRRDAAHHRGLFLEHYPGMSEQALLALAQEVSERWPTLRVLAWHRVGELAIGEVIVLTGVAAAHRAEAFEACCYLMDQVKTRVPLWKKVLHDQGADWVEARDKDLDAAARWFKS